MNNQPQTGVEVFEHPKNIVVGKGRVLWGDATTDLRGNYHPQGWVLPGGRRTSVRSIAELVASNINRLSR